MASPAVFPAKGVALRINFAIRDVTGALVKGWTVPTALVVKDDGAAVSSTNTPVEHATSNGTGYLDLTASEMNANSVVVVVSVTNSNAKEAVVVIDTGGLAEIVNAINADPWPDAGDTLDITRADGQLALLCRYLINAHAIDRSTGIHYIFKDGVDIADVTDEDGNLVTPVDSALVFAQGTDVLTRVLAAIGAKVDPSA